MRPCTMYSIRPKLFVILTFLVILDLKKISSYNYFVMRLNINIYLDAYKKDCIEKSQNDKWRRG
jgi:hypothetical protein